MGIEYPADYLNCKPDDANGENELLSDAKAFCDGQNMGGKFDCHLIDVDPLDTQRSKLVQRLSEPSCDSTAGALSTDSEDATIAIDSLASWISVEHRTGNFKTAVAGVVMFRGGNCDGDDCPLSLTYLGIKTPMEVSFVHSDGKKTVINRPYVRIPDVVKSMTSKKIAIGTPGYEFAFPAGALRVWASGSVDGRRVLIAASNEQDSTTGRLLKSGEFLFDATATADDFKVTLHLVGRVRTWPPFLRVDSATFKRQGRREFLELEVRAFSWVTNEVALYVAGPRFAVPVRTKKGGARVEVPRNSTGLVLRACATGVCVERTLVRPEMEGPKHHAE